MSYRNCSERTNYVRCIVQWISIAVRSAANHCTNTLCSNVRSGPGSVVGTTTGYGLDAPGIDTVTDIPKNLTFVKSVHHHHTIKIIQTRRCRSFTSLLLDVYVWLQMFRASPRPSSGAYNCTRSLWFNRWSTAAGALLVVVCQITVFRSHLVSMCGSKCFGRLPVHHQEHTTTLGVFGLTVGVQRPEQCLSCSANLPSLVRILSAYVAQNVSGVSPPIIRSIQLHWESLV